MYVNIHEHWKTSQPSSIAKNKFQYHTYDRLHIFHVNVSYISCLYVYHFIHFIHDINIINQTGI